MKPTYLLLSILTFLTAHTFAQTHTWTGDGIDNLWTSPENWDALTVPSPTSDVLITGIGAEVLLTSPGSSGTINLQNNAELVVQSDISINNLLTINEAVMTIVETGKLQNNGTTIIIEAGAKLVVEGEINNTSGAINIMEDGEFFFVNGTIHGGTLQNNGLFQIEGIPIHRLENLSVINNALLFVSESNITQLTNVTIENTIDAIIDIPSNGGFLEQNHNSSLTNVGIIRKSQGPGALGNFYLVLEVKNSGTIEVLEDQTFLLLAGSRPFVNLNSGAIIGSGTYDITADFINMGTVYPNTIGSIGSLSITNVFNVDDGIIGLDIAGENEGEYDTIRVTGSPRLNGSFEINLQYAPDIGDSFNVITWTNNGGSCMFPQFTTAVFNEVTYTFETLCSNNAVSLIVSESTLGILDLDKSRNLTLAPNPANEITTLSIPEITSFTSKYSINIYTILGQKVMEQSGLAEGDNTLNINRLQSGIYMITLLNDDRLVSTTKFIKK